jgi:hypothetical protein
MKREERHDERDRQSATNPALSPYPRAPTANVH